MLLEGMGLIKYHSAGKAENLQQRKKLTVYSDLLEDKLAQDCTSSAASLFEQLLKCVRFSTPSYFVNHFHRVGRGVKIKKLQIGNFKILCVIVITLSISINRFVFLRNEREECLKRGIFEMYEI